MKQRDQVQMTAAQAAEFLAAGRKVQLATNGPDGFPHLVTMYYVLIDGQIAFWTYRRSQKARNLERDPRISCLVETGEQYFDLRGVLVQGTARRIENPVVIAEVGRLITSVLTAPPGTAGSVQPDPQPVPPESADPLAEYVERAARKRYAYTVEPARLISWDHTLLVPPATDGATPAQLVKERMAPGFFALGDVVGVGSPGATVTCMP